MRLTVPLARDLVMLGLGSSGMTRELFFVPTPDMTRVWVCIGLLLGPAALASVWRMRNPLPGEENTPGVPSSPPSRSVSPPSGS